jgi:CDGSH-type Zn-finger protein
MIDVVVAAKEPVQVDVVEGKSYWWCACGRSKNQPFCDGSHQGTGFEPVEYVAPRSRKLFMCQCKKTLRAPICDGQHNKL